MKSICKIIKKKKKMRLLMSKCFKKKINSIKSWSISNYNSGLINPVQFPIPTLRVVFVTVVVQFYREKFSHIFCCYSIFLLLLLFTCGPLITPVIV